MRTLPLPPPYEGGEKQEPPPLSPPYEGGGQVAGPAHNNAGSHANTYGCEWLRPAGAARSDAWRIVMASLLADIDWNTLLQARDTLVFLVIPATLVVIILGVVIAVQWRKVQQAKYDAELKLRMIEHGFTADQIKTVLSTSAGGSRGRIGVCAVDLRGLRELAGGSSAEHAGHSAGCG
jgi:hypothetical protein